MFHGTMRGYSAQNILRCWDACELELLVEEHVSCFCAGVQRPAAALLAQELDNVDTAPLERVSSGAVDDRPQSVGAGPGGAGSGAASEASLAGTPAATPAVNPAIPAMVAAAFGGRIPPAIQKIMLRPPRPFSDWRSGRPANEALGQVMLHEALARKIGYISNRHVVGGSGKESAINIRPSGARGSSTNLVKNSRPRSSRRLWQGVGATRHRHTSIGFGQYMATNSRPNVAGASAKELAMNTYPISVKNMVTSRRPYAAGGSGKSVVIYSRPSAAGSSGRKSATNSRPLATGGDGQAWAGPHFSTTPSGCSPK